MHLFKKFNCIRDLKISSGVRAMEKHSITDPMIEDFKPWHHEYGCFKNE